MPEFARADLDVSTFIRQKTFPNVAESSSRNRTLTYLTDEVRQVLRQFTITANNFNFFQIDMNRGTYSSSMADFRYVGSRWFRSC